MKKIDKILLEYKNYKDTADDLCSRLDEKINSVEQVAALMASLRRHIEHTLPKISIQMNLLSEDEYSKLFDVIDVIDIDEYGCRLKLFDLLADPSKFHKEKFIYFKENANIR